MKTVLVIAEESGLAGAVQAVLAADQYRILAMADLRDLKPLIGQGIIDVCILDAELDNINPVRRVQQLRSWLPNCPLLLYATARQWEWEEEVWLAGITQLLAKPVRGNLLNLLLSRLWEPGVPVAVAGSVSPVSNGKCGALPSASSALLPLLRDFAKVLQASLDTRQLIETFLGVLREILQVNRAAIFMRAASVVLQDDLAGFEDHALRPLCAVGLNSRFLQHVVLSLDGGIGRFAQRQGRLLTCRSPEALADREILKEFELLGAQVALPILDRETLLGVAVFDGRLTGEPFSHEDLAVLFHLLEEIGLGIRNSWLHDQLRASHARMTDILDHLGSACLVIGPSMRVLHANRAAAEVFLKPRGYKPPLEFSHLPGPVGSMVYNALRQGVEPGSAKFSPPERADVLYEVSVRLLHRTGDALAAAALVVVEDCTHEERARRMEIESSNLRMVRAMTEHLAHEIGNSLAPLSAHQQMMALSYADPEFQVSLSSALASGVHRIGRLANQMLHFSREPVLERSLLLPALIEEAFQECRQHFPDKVPRIALNDAEPTLCVQGDHRALRQAFSEILLNGLQANPSDPRVEVRFRQREEGPTCRRLVIEIRDAGPGFTAETAQRATEPFFSTRVVGLGLGLTIARRIVEAHGGQLELVPSLKHEPGLVRISLPAAPPTPVPVAVAAVADALPAFTSARAFAPKGPLASRQPVAP